MRIGSTNSLLTTLGLALPGVAHAQQISPLIAGLALSPILVLLLAIALGIVSRSWWVGAKHTGLVVVWVVLFAIASYWVENDYIIWTPLALYAAHSVIMLALLIQRLVQRVAR